MRTAVASSAPARGVASELLVAVLRAGLRLHQLVLSPLLGPACRFAPSCSEYAREALAVHGPFTGSVLAVRRVLRCHPYGGAGFDPVPPPAQAARPAKEF